MKKINKTDTNEKESHSDEEKEQNTQIRIEKLEGVVEILNDNAE